MAKEVKIKITEVKNVKLPNGVAFKAYRCALKDGNIMDLKFQRAAHNIPTERCWIYVSEGNFNVSRRKEYPVVWVKDVNRIEPITVKAADYDLFYSADEAETNPF